VRFDGIRLLKICLEWMKSVLWWCSDQTCIILVWCKSEVVWGPIGAVVHYDNSKNLRVFGNRVQGQLIYDPWCLLLGRLLHKHDCPEFLVHFWKQRQSSVMTFSSALEPQRILQFHSILIQPVTSLWGLNFKLHFHFPFSSSLNKQNLSLSTQRPKQYKSPSSGMPYPCPKAALKGISIDLVNQPQAFKEVVKQIGLSFFINNPSPTRAQNERTW
jgi:hypothetical protein